VIGKRLFDLIVSTISLIILSPLFLVIALLIKLNSKGPIFYRGVRSGLYGKPFKIFKFRTMVTNAEKVGGFSTALNDPRLTRMGRFLRKYKFDELPQFINVLKGEMSLVGPRPQVEHYTKLYNNEEKIILSVKPGLTDYASIQFINLDQILGDERVDEKYFQEIEPEKNRLRMKYAQEHSFLIDMKILILTFLNMLKIKSTWNIKN
jgi:lipopolysaccharide/colanic/teichoic acid biosynthesis glycosyltransferase